MNCCAYCMNCAAVLQERKLPQFMQLFLQLMLRCIAGCNIREYVCVQLLLTKPYITMNEKHFADKQAAAVHTCSEHKCLNCFEHRGCIHLSYPLIPEHSVETAIVVQQQNKQAETQMHHRAA